MTDDVPGPSRTSRAVAVTRATFDRPHSPDGDPRAQSRLCAGMPPRFMSERVPSLRARTRFFDDEVLAALARGVPQIVILGAGYDDRALRFRSPGVHFFEIDHPATQYDKIRRLADLDPRDPPTLAPADFATDTIGPVLDGAGHDATRPSLFLCEGLLVYLDQPTIIRLLAGLRARAHPASTLAASLAVHGDDVDSERFGAVANSRRLAGATEPWLTILRAGEHLALLTRSGWTVERVVDQSDLDSDLPRDRSLLVVTSALPASR